MYCYIVQEGSPCVLEYYFSDVCAQSIDLGPTIGGHLNPFITNSPLCLKLFPATYKHDKTYCIA